MESAAAAAGPLVTVGVPVFRGEAYLADALDSIRRQTYQSLEVVISLDEPNEACQAICEPFLVDCRFRFVQQPQRLGWAGHISWLMANASGMYFYYHQQDDLVAERYVETLVAHAERHPESAMAYCDVKAFGHLTSTTAAPSISGETPFLRAFAALKSRYHAVAFRGLARASAIREAGPIATNRFDDFACDTTWLAGLALSGELQRVPETLYLKRYHGQNVHLGWSAWEPSRAGRAWSAHCADMLRQALRAKGTTLQERQLLWLAAVERLLSPHAAGGYLPLAELTTTDRAEMFEAFVSDARETVGDNLPAVFGVPSWQHLERWTRPFFQLATDESWWLEPATVENFDEERYLTANPDVRDAVRSGRFVTGRDHFNACGAAERRQQLRAV